MLSYECPDWIEHTTEAEQGVLKGARVPKVMPTPLVGLSKPHTFEAPATADAFGAEPPEDVSAPPTPLIVRRQESVATAASKLPSSMPTRSSLPMLPPEIEVEHPKHQENRSHSQLHLDALYGDLHAMWKKLPSTIKLRDLEQPQIAEHHRKLREMLSWRDYFGLTPCQRAYQCWKLCSRHPQYRASFVQLLVAQLLLHPQLMLKPTEMHESLEPSERPGMCTLTKHEVPDFEWTQGALMRLHEPAMRPP